MDLSKLHVAARSRAAGCCGAHTLALGEVRRRALTLAAIAWALLAGASILLAPLARAEGRCGSHPWCDTSLSPEQRGKLLLAAMRSRTRSAS